MNTSLSLKLLVGLAMLTTASSPALAQQSRHDAKVERKAERRAEQAQKKAINQIERDQRRADNSVRRTTNNIYVPPQPNNFRRDNDRRDDHRFDNNNRWDNRHDRGFDDRNFDNRSSNNNNRGHWDNRWYDRSRQQASLDRRFRNWNDQRDYIKANLRQINKIAKLNALQQQQLNAQMQAAYLAYHNNNWNGGYNWDYYSEPQFLDYLHSSQPSLLDKILGYLGIGTAGNGYLYSSDWGVERGQLADNMYRIHQLALEGRITPLQEQQLLAQMRAEFSAYHNNNWNGTYGWSQYSDPGFIDYLNTSRPSVLTTIRSYLGM
jgi:type II secretory pathway pseudopilin PulG